jgi:CubicO group peptidase (beta-lactamase class C family)
VPGFAAAFGACVASTVGRLTNRRIALSPFLPREAFSTPLGGWAMKRTLCAAILAATAAWCHSSLAGASGEDPPTTATSTPAAAARGQAATPQTEKLRADTQKATVTGNRFMAPAGWTVKTRGSATILEAPEGGSWLALVDVRAPDADAAVAAAWHAYGMAAPWPLKVASDSPDQDGWTDRRRYTYQTSPNAKRDVTVDVQRANGVWTTVIYDMAQAVGEKRLAQVELVLGDLLPKGYTRESFSGRTALRLDAAKLKDLGKFVDESMRALGIPGVAIGVVQDGKVVLAQGHGVRELGGSDPVDADTLFMIGSNTKALTTLMLAKLVDAGKIGWETPVTTLLPSFRLGDAATTAQVKVKHLICACTGLPRQDLEFIFENGGQTPTGTVATLASMQPTSAFGEMFQYSNLLAAVAGFVGGHVVYPQEELGAAYDKAMQELVFSPLQMGRTTFDYVAALRGNHAMPHAPNISGDPAKALLDPNYSIMPVRPAGAAWSNVNDMLRYVSMELTGGLLPDRRRYMSGEPLLARRASQVPIGKNATYGMGLEVDATYGVPVVHHGGATFGYLSDMMWLPDYGVGAVILTNSDTGYYMLYPFQRKLLELLFDGRPEANAMVVSRGKTYFEQLAAERKLLRTPADPAESAKLAKHYVNESLGAIAVSTTGSATVFDFGEWASEVATRRNEDGTVSFVTITPGVSGFEFVAGTEAARTLTTRDAQHEYVFRVQAP